MVGWLKFNIIEKIPFMVHLEIQCITFKTETSFIAHPWIKLSVVGLEVYSAHDWRAATSVQRAPVTWREWGLWFKPWGPTTFSDWVSNTEWKNVRIWGRYLHYIGHHFGCWSWLRWHHNGPDGVSNYQPRDCLLNHLFRRRSKKTSKLPVTGLCVGNSPVTGEFPAQRASNAENVSIWWCHHASKNVEVASVIATEIIYFCQYPGLAMQVLIIMQMSTWLN